MSVSRISSKEEADSKLKLFVMALTAKFGRLPTDDEVHGYIFGDSETRKKIWNQEQ